MKKELNTGKCIFFTGLSGSGKSTLAFKLVEEFNDFGIPITLLDGDIIRTHLSKGLGFSKEDRDTNIKRVGFVASEVAKHGGVSICSVIAPYEKTRELVRELVEENGKFILVYLSTSLEVCESRDPKGNYKKVRNGEIKNFTGITDPYEAPKNSDVIIDTHKYNIDDCIGMIFEKFWDL